MAVLPNIRHEQFVQGLASRLNATHAYIKVYGESKGAQQSAARLLSNAVVCSRLVELQTAISAEFIQLEISNRNARIQALQEIWDRGRRLIDARAEGPGGHSRRQHGAAG